MTIKNNVDHYQKELDGYQKELDHCHFCITRQAISPLLAINIFSIGFIAKKNIKKCEKLKKLFGN
jgi:hypothetical protein